MKMDIQRGLQNWICLLPSVTFLACFIISESSSAQPFIEADITAFPYAVYIIVGKDEIFCGGALIHASYAITAASCLLACRADPWHPTYCPDLDTCNIKVYAGQSVSTSSTNYKVHVSSVAEKVIYHPNLKFMDYGESCKWKNDIAVIKLLKPLAAQPVEMDDFIYVDDRNVSNLLQTTFSNCKLIGYGYKQAPGSGRFLDGRLKWSQVHTNDTQDCYDIYNRPDYPGRLPVYGFCKYYDLCSGGSDVSVCPGDAGNPLVCGGVLIGVLSKIDSSNCYAAGYKGDADNSKSLTYQGYTRIDVNRQWLDSVIAKTKSS